jgi:electron transport complex protein RnfD
MASAGATPLAAFKFDGIVVESYELAMGLISGSTGETSSLLILLGGLYLVARNMMNWRIPRIHFRTVFALSGILYLIDPGLSLSPSSCSSPEA